MIPAKNRDRKCSTCRHYQPSPLWRKGWCRNPLLYDRNTNHLVEGDSLACNRTFIDYWEPMTGPAPEVAPQARSNKPRIAPSIPVNTMDAKGNRSVVTGNTPAAGMAAAAPAASHQRWPEPLREPPKLSLVTPDFEPVEMPTPPGEAAKVTRQIEQVEGPGPYAGEAPAAQTAAQKVAARRKSRGFFGTRNGLIVMLLLGVLVLAALGGAFVMGKRDDGKTVAGALTTPTITVPVPTPTGFGDATATPKPTNTPVVPPANVIGVNGWIQVKAGGGLTLRDAPGKAGAKIRVLRDGTTGHVVDGPKDADGLQWWKLDNIDPKNPALSGWCAAQYLTPIPQPPK